MRCGLWRGVRFIHIVRAALSSALQMLLLLIVVACAVQQCKGQAIVQGVTLMQGGLSSILNDRGRSIGRSVATVDSYTVVGSAADPSSSTVDPRDVSAPDSGAAHIFDSAGSYIRYLKHPAPGLLVH